MPKSPFQNLLSSVKSNKILFVLVAVWCMSVFIHHQVEAIAEPDHEEHCLLCILDISTASVDLPDTDSLYTKDLVTPNTYLPIPTSFYFTVYVPRAPPIFLG